MAAATSPASATTDPITLLSSSAPAARVFPDKACCCGLLSSTHSTHRLMPDLGARAAGREPQPATPHLLSDAALNASALRRSDAVVNFRAQSVEAGHVPLQNVSAKVTTDHGIVTVAPLLAAVLAFVDPGLTKDADCGALISAATAVPQKDQLAATAPGR
jgi:hypothetical protein